MSRDKKIIISMFVGIAVFIISYSFVLVRNAEALRHIYPASSGEAVYIGTKKEPACVINAGLERTPGEMTEDFGECLKLHKKYRALVK